MVVNIVSEIKEIIGMKTSIRTLKTVSIGDHKVT